MHVYKLHKLNLQLKRIVTVFPTDRLEKLLRWGGSNRWQAVSSEGKESVKVKRRESGDRRGTKCNNPGVGTTPRRAANN